MQNYWNRYLAWKQQQLYGPVNYRDVPETGPKTKLFCSKWSKCSAWRGSPIIVGGKTHNIALQLVSFGAMLQNKSYVFVARITALFKAFYLNMFRANKVLETCFIFLEKSSYFFRKRKTSSPGIAAYVGLCCCIVWLSFLFDCFVKILATCQNFLGK